VLLCCVVEQAAKAKAATVARLILVKVFMVCTSLVSFVNAVLIPLLCIFITFAH
jgi:hypothetical protein